MAWRGALSWRCSAYPHVDAPFFSGVSRSVPGTIGGKLPDCTWVESGLNTQNGLFPEGFQSKSGNLRNLKKGWGGQLFSITRWGCEVGASKPMIFQNLGVNPLVGTQSDPGRSCVTILGEFAAKYVISFFKRKLIIQCSVKKKGLEGVFKVFLVS